MDGRDLKNYERYLKQIELYARASCVKIKYSSKDGDEGVYQPRGRVIFLDPTLTQSYEIAVLLHELGHSMDDTLVSKKTETVLERAYARIYNEKATPKQRLAVIECEKRAWVYARSIARRLRIPLGKWFEDFRKECLASYRK